jgi:DNA-binding winged helix-turn-helix (wHTH) protein
MPHLLVIDIDDATVAAIEELVRSRAVPPSVVQFKLNGQKVQGLMPNGANPNPMPTVALAAAPPTINMPEEFVHKYTLQPGSNVEPVASRIYGFSVPAVRSRTLHFASWRLDLAMHELRAADDSLVPLSEAEFELLYVLAKHPHRRLTRHQILDLMRGRARLSRTRSIDVYISRLRRKLEVDFRSPEIVQTVRNGYTFSAAVTIGQ